MRAARRDDANPYRGTGYEIVGFIDDDPRLQHGRLKASGCWATIDCWRDGQKLSINEIILAITNTQTISDEMMNALLHCREMGLRVVTMATVYERLTGRVPIDYVGRDLHMVLPMDDNAMERAYQDYQAPDRFCGRPGWHYCDGGHDCTHCHHRIASPARDHCSTNNGASAKAAKSSKCTSSARCALTPSMAPARCGPARVMIASRRRARFCARPALMNCPNSSTYSRAT